MKKLKLFICLSFVVCLLSACSSIESETPISLENIITKSQKAGLNIKSPTEIISEKHALSNIGFIGSKRILVPALGENEGGYLFLFDSQDSLKKLKDDYTELGYYSHIYTKDNILLQMSHKMNQTEFNKYIKVLDEL